MLKGQQRGVRRYNRWCRDNLGVLFIGLWSVFLKRWSIRIFRISASGLKEFYCMYDLNYPYKKAHKMLWCWFSNYEIHIFQIIHCQINKVLLHTVYPAFKVTRIHHFCWKKNQSDVRLTAIVFSLIPPTGRTFPVRETSPVIATSCRTGMSFARDKSAVTTVQPALGPSLGVAPYNTSIKNTHTHW